jgi:metal-sulfur cluster biosynthetic enzyme
MTEQTKVSSEQVMEAIAPIKDPEIMLGIVDLGLIYDVAIDDENVVTVTFTLTTPACPLGPVLVAQIEDAVMAIDGVKDVTTELTFTPRWDPRSMASDEIKMQLGIW